MCPLTQREETLSSKSVYYTNVFATTFAGTKLIQDRKKCKMQETHRELSQNNHVIPWHTKIVFNYYPKLSRMEKMVSRIK